MTFTAGRLDTSHEHLVRGSKKEMKLIRLIADLAHICKQCQSLSSCEDILKKIVMDLDALTDCMGLLKITPSNGIISVE